MPALDPFSASSRPMPPMSFDAGPSKPLGFAASFEHPLHSVDLNRLPKPRRAREPAPNFPASPFTHSRQTSAGSIDFKLDFEVGGDDWMQAEIAKCVDAATGTLDLKNKGLTRLSTKISDLKHLVTLPTYSPLPIERSPLGQGGANSSRPFARTVSAPASANAFHQMRQTSQTTAARGFNLLLSSPKLAEEAAPMKKREFGRSKTGRTSVAPRELHLLLGPNLLTSLPSALFEISHLTMLSLRGNKLTTLPAAIGQLIHLTELNISNNQITDLPSTILNLDLHVFNVHPNPFLKPFDKLGPIVSRTHGSVPRLSSLCLSLLLSPPAPGDLPPLLDAYDWGSHREALLNPDALREIIPSIARDDLERVLQLFRSAGQGRTQRSTPDDASKNPYFYSCPSSRHTYYSSDVRSRQHLFLHAAEERHRWVTICGNAMLPVKYLGCSPGCLAYLEEEEDWEVDM